MYGVIGRGGVHSKGYTCCSTDRYPLQKPGTLVVIRPRRQFCSRREAWRAAISAWTDAELAVEVEAMAWAEVDAMGWAVEVDENGEFLRVETCVG